MFKNRIIFICFVVMLFFIASCVNPSKIHHRSVNRGYEHDTTIVRVKVTDTIRLNGKDSIITKFVDINCPEFEAQPTRYETRWKYKIQKDSIKLIQYVTKWKTKEIIKVKRIEDKVSFWQWIRIFIVGLSVGYIINFLVRNLKR